MCPLFYLAKNLLQGGSRAARGDDSHPRGRYELESKLFGSDVVDAILMNDVNIDQDKDVPAVGGIPAGIEDLWIRSGSRKECQWTWDMMRNTNKEVRDND